MLASDPEMEKAIREIIRTALKELRGELSGAAKQGLDMKSDPRQAYKAIKTTVYRQVLGGNVSILNRRRAGAPQDTWMPSTHTGRGGNRRKRSGRTKSLQSYWGYDRGFVLRFLNQGTTQRAIKYLELTPRADYGHKSRMVSRPDKYGNRGSIRPRNWFGRASLEALQDEMGVITARIEELILGRFNS